MLGPEDQALLDGVLHAHGRGAAARDRQGDHAAGDRRAPTTARRADALLNALLPASGKSLRLGISGVPGVGKSTFIEALGLHLIEHGPSRRGAGGRPVVQRVGRLDPRRQDAHGAAVGRGERASSGPSPTSGTLGGVAAKTREAMLVLRGGGPRHRDRRDGRRRPERDRGGRHDRLFVLLQLPNAGDDLQAIKKGVMELADLVVDQQGRPRRGRRDARTGADHVALRLCSSAC